MWFPEYLPIRNEPWAGTRHPGGPWGPGASPAVLTRRKRSLSGADGPR
jgi:hypothetical protein